MIAMKYLNCFVDLVSNESDLHSCQDSVDIIDQTNAAVGGKNLIS